MDRTTRETTMLKTAVIVMVLLLCSTGLARPFVGAFASGNYVTNTEADSLVVSLGAQAGVHNLLGLLGARGTLELSVYPDFALAGSFPDRANYHLTEVAGRCRPGRSPGSNWPGSLSRGCRPYGCRRARAPCSSICERGRATTSASKGAVSSPRRSGDTHPPP
jgi:hypothetical protein